MMKKKIYVWEIPLNVWSENIVSLTVVIFLKSAEKLINVHFNQYVGNSPFEQQFMFL
jgi:hypothetical protein